MEAVCLPFVFLFLLLSSTHKKMAQSSEVLFDKAKSQLRE